MTSLVAPLPLGVIVKLVPVLAFGLLELLVILAIIAIVIALFGPSVAKMFGKAKKAGGNTRTKGSWSTAPATIPPNTPTSFVLSVKIETLDPNGVVTNTDVAPELSPVMFDFTVTKGAGQLVSVSAAGSALPLNKSAAPNSPVTDIPGSTDTNGAVTVVVQLEENSTATLSAHEMPSTVPAALRANQWTVPPITFSSP